MSASNRGWRATTLSRSASARRGAGSRHNRSGCTCTAPEGKRVSHAPDYFARRADRSAVVLDCRPVDRRKPADVAKFDATAAACVSLGWEYRLAGAADPIRTANLRWLAGYRHPRYRIEAAG